MLVKFRNVIQKIIANKVAVIAIGIVVLIALFYLFMNSSYFVKQISYTFRKPAPETTSVQQSMEPNRLIIPSLNIETPIVESGENNEKAFQKALESGVVHYPGTAMVGEVGNSYIFGHSSDFAFKGGDYKTVFALLPRIENGAEIVVSNPKGIKFTYKVVNQFVAASTDTHLLDQNTNGKKILTLQTSYPIGTALKRYIVVGEMVE